MTADSAAAAYQAAYDDAAWAALPADSFYVRGKDAATVLHKLCSNQVESLQAGEWCEAFACTVQGKIVGHVWITREPDGLRVDTSPGQADRLIQHFDRYVIREDVEFSNASGDRHTMVLLGPQASAALHELADVELPDAGEASSHRWVEVGTTAESSIQLRGFERRGWLLTGSLDAVEAWKIRLGAAGVPNATASWDALRIECGYPLYGRDISEDNLPQEVNRNDQAISFTKGCYLGQEPVARIDAMGHVNWILMGLRQHGEANEQPAAWDAGMELAVDGKRAARVTSSSLSPQFGVIGLAYVRRAQAMPGTVLSHPEGAPVAEVAAVPFAQ